MEGRLDCMKRFSFLSLRTIKKKKGPGGLEETLKKALEVQIGNTQDELRCAWDAVTPGPHLHEAFPCPPSQNDSHTFLTLHCNCYHCHSTFHTANSISTSPAVMGAISGWEMCHQLLSPHSANPAPLTQKILNNGNWLNFVSMDKSFIFLMNFLHSKQEF